MIHKSLVACCLAFLSACGGGGGGGGDGGGGTTPTSGNPAPVPALRFAPEVVAANYRAGSPMPVSVQADVVNPQDFATVKSVYTYVIDTKQVLQGQVNIQPLSAQAYSITFYPSALLQPGHYQDSFQIRLCKDSNCSSEFPGSPVPLRYDFTVTDVVAPLGAAPVMPTQATVHIGAPAPADVAVNVTGDKLIWNASTTAAWLRIKNSSGTGTGSFNVAFNPTGLGEGTYSDKVTVTSKDGQSTSIAFSLTVLPTNFTITSGVPTFNAVNGADIAAQMLTFELDSKVASPWTATSSANWLLAGPLSGTTPGSITLQPDPTKGPLASGNYASTIVLKSPNVYDKTLTSALTLTKPTLATTASAITLGGAKGRDFSPRSVTMSLNTGTKSWGWNLSGLPQGVTASATSGSVNVNGASTTFTADPTRIALGSSSQVIHLTSQINGDAIDAPVTVNLNKDTHKLTVSEYGVGLSSTPLGDVLNRSIKVFDNYGGNVEWTASSNASWLTVTANGTTGAATGLAISANPSALTADTVSYATVTVTPTDASVQPVYVQVALWKSTTAPTQVVKLPLNYDKIVADRIRPYVYAHNGGTSIDVFNAYTAVKIGSIATTAGSLGAMTTSPDGKQLYVIDTPNQRCITILLDTLAQGAIWDLSNAITSSGYGVGPFTTALAIKPNGVDVLLLGEGYGVAYRLSDGKRLGATGIPGELTSAVLSASPDGTKVYSILLGRVPPTAAAYDIDYSDVSNGILMVAQKANFLDSGGTLGKDIAVSNDASKVYLAAYRFMALEAATLSPLSSLPGDPFPNNVEVTYDGRALVGTSIWQGADLWVHSASGAILNFYRIAGDYRALKDQQMVVTPDGIMVVALTNDPLIAFVAIGP